MSELNFYYAVMAAGKSTQLLQLNFSLKNKGFSPLLLKSSLDTRDEGVIKSRIGLEEKCNLIQTNDIISEFSNELLYASHILVDEAQFLNRDQIDSLCKIVDFQNKPVYCFGLRTDFRGQLFEGSSHLFALADNLVEVPMVSKDGRKTVLHLKLKNGKPVFDGNSVEVGGDELYESVSRKEWFTYKIKDKKR